VLHRRHVHPGKKRGPLVGKTKSGKGTKLMVLADGAGTPLGVHLEAASPSEVRLVEATLDSVKVKVGKRERGKPKRLIGDRGYDSNPVRALLAKRGIEPIIPARSNNKVATHQDGRKLRRYKRRWIIERSNSWLQTFRRLVVRYERSEKIYAALVHMACALITLKRI
jgi:transposase